MSKKKKVYLALSGGVDSSVALALLLEQGYDVIPIFMKCWSDEFMGWQYPGECPWEKDQKDAMAVCEQLGVLDKFQSWNFEPEFFENVLQHFIAEHQAGRTPNPDVVCNQTIKFGKFFDRAVKQGADLVATGHYARVQSIEADSRKPPVLSELERKAASWQWQLLVAKCEPKNDQTYFLYRISQYQLAHTFFPIGEFGSKTEVKRYADKLGLKTADGQPLSQRPSTKGICFVGKGRHTELLSRSIPLNPGPVITREGKVVGQHPGVAFITLGQRKGIGLWGGTPPLYVVEKDLDKNTLVVGPEWELWKKELVASECWWISGKEPEFPMRAYAAIRHPQENLAAPCVVSQLDADFTQTNAGKRFRGDAKSGQGLIQVRFDEEQWAPCPGQSVVFYDEQKEVVLGGGVIQ